MNERDRQIRKDNERFDREIRRMHRRHFWRDVRFAVFFVIIMIGGLYLLVNPVF